MTFGSLLKLLTTAPSSVFCNRKNGSVVPYAIESLILGKASLDFKKESQHVKVYSAGNFFLLVRMTIFNFFMQLSS